MAECIDYGLDEVQESNVPQGAPSLAGPLPVRWIQWDQPTGEPELRATVADWGLHPHVATDLLDDQGRANLEEYPEQLYLDVHAVVSAPKESLRFAHVGLVAHRAGLISVHRPGVLDAVAERIRSNRGLVRSKGPDYLLIRILDAVVRPYDQHLDALENTLDQLETEVVHRPSQRIVVKLLQAKRQISALRRHVTPLREVVGSLEASSHPVLARENRPYLRDVKGKVQALYERLEAQRGLLESLEGLYLSSVGQRTNEVMRILTVFSAVFMPLTFIAGVYGMNFRAMPELNWPWAYPAVLLLMASVAAGMVSWMKRKRFW